MIHTIDTLGGGAALLIICLVLFCEEAGMPLPFLPGDGLLVAAGVLVGSGRLSWFALLPAATVAMVLGALIAYAWSRRIGPVALGRIGRRLGCEGPINRAVVRLRSTGSMGVFIGRNLPGMRVYTNMAAGAAGIPLRRFVIGMVAAVITWVVGFGLLGAVAGQAVVHAVERAEHAVASGALCLLVAAIFVALAALVPTAPSRRRPGSARPWRSAPIRVAIALSLDLAAVALLTLGIRRLAAVVRNVPATDILATAAVGAVLVVAYVVALRRLSGPTLGERLLGVRAGAGPEVATRS